MVSIKNLLSVLTIVCISVAFQTASAQTTLKNKVTNRPISKIKQQYAVKPAKLTGFEAAAADAPLVSVPPAQVTLRGIGIEEQAGKTTYDLQTNGCAQARVHAFADGEVGMAWTWSNGIDGSNWPDRGSAYNRRSAWTTGVEPTGRVEATTRTGFTNYVATENGTEIILGHTALTTAGTYRIHMARRAAGATTWTESNLPTNTPFGGLWCKAAADGNNIHVIMLTTPSGTFGGAAYRGVDGHVLYYRSQDAGATWDIIDGVIPGIDSSAYRSIGGDAYTITARDGVVAVGVFEGWGDTKVIKSSDNGTTWTEFIVNDFPLDKYTFDTAYEPSGPYDGAPEPDGVPDPWAFFTSDEKGSVAIDLLGNVHCSFGEMWVRDSIFGDASSNYYPGTDGLVYWNETDPENLYAVSFALDRNGNDTLDLNGTLIPYGAAGLLSYSNLATDKDGSNIYLLYSGVAELLVDVAGNHYRHVYALKSEDLGVNWGAPIDIHYALDDADPITADFTEGVFISANKLVDGKLQFQYQRDYTAGNVVQTTAVENTAPPSEIVYVGSSELVVSSTKNPKNTLDFSVSPNPTSGLVNISFDVKDAAQTTIQVVDVMGAVVRTSIEGQLTSGFQTTTINTAGLPNGAYFVRVQSGNSIGTKKLMVLNR